MFKKLGLALLLVMLLVPFVQAQDKPHNKPGEYTPKGQQVAAPLDFGVLQYDPGTPADGFLQGMSAGYPNPNYFGNLFNSRNGNPLSGGTIYQVSFYQGAFASVTPLAFLDVRSAAASTGFSQRTFYPITNSYTFLAFSFSPISVGPSFFAGMAHYYGFFGNVGVRSASFNGQGFHGQQVAFFGGGTNNLTGQNVMVRVAGDILVPVELMEYEVD